MIPHSKMVALAMHEVWLLLLPGFPLVDVSQMLAVLETANALRTNGSVADIYRVQLTSFTGGRVLSSSGVALATRALPCQPGDSSRNRIIAGGPPATSSVGVAEGVQRLLHDCRSSSPQLRARRVVLGAVECMSPHARKEGAGALAADPAMPHWPLVEPGLGLDLALSWVEQDWGTAVADAVASQLPEPRSQHYGMTRYRSALVEQSFSDPRIDKLNLWIATHLREKSSTARLAQEVHMSARSLARFYRRATGLTPGRGVQQIRLDSACRLIETSTRPLKAIAAQCGYGSQEVMRRAFLRVLAITPLEYRRRHAPERHVQSK